MFAANCKIQSYVKEKVYSNPTSALQWWATLVSSHFDIRERVNEAGNGLV